MEEDDKQHKISIRFFNDKEVRAAWDDTGNRWLFSVADVIAVLTESKNPRNYWKVMKHRLAKEGNELVTRCNQLKLVAADGKCYLTDCLPQNEILNLVEATPSQHAVAFARWLITGENQIDSKYFYYLLSQQSFFDYMMSGSKGCKMPRGDKKQIMQWPFDLPPFEEQKRIASILSSFDAKIELNRRINDNLEQQAQALFKSWFIDSSRARSSRMKSRAVASPPAWAAMLKEAS